MDTNLNSIEVEMRKKENTRKYIIQLFDNFKQDLQGTQTVKFLMKRKYYLIKDLLSICDNGFVCSFAHPERVSLAKDELLKCCSKCYENCDDLSLVDIDYISKLNDSIQISIFGITSLFESFSGKNLVLQLLDYYAYLPTDSEYCFYCYKNKMLSNRDACIKCEYAKIHKSCMNNTSDYSNMMYKINELIDIIEEETN